MTRCIEVGQATLSKDDPNLHLEDARTLYLDTLRALRTRRYQIVLDGEEVTGEFLLVEALNTPSIGPQLELTEDVSVSDGFLSVVIVGESERAALSDHLSALQGGAVSAAGFKSWRVRAVAITGADRVHVDDRVIDAGGSIRIETRPLTLSILA